LETGEGDLARVGALEVTEKDWPTYRASNSRNANSRVTVPSKVRKLWEYQPTTQNFPTAPTAAGGLLFVGGDDGKIRAIDASTALNKWEYLTAGPILQPPSLWQGRAYVGSGDGYVYALEAATGRLLWRFRAAPVERRIMVYGALCSTWPVNSGVLVAEGVAYAAAGIIDYDGTYVYALDAMTGEIKWQNNSSGHLDKQLRKGVSAQGNLTLADGKLWMPGGNVISPAVYNHQTGEYLGGPPGDGSPKANRGEEIGVLNLKHVIFGGRLRFSATKNVVDPGTFQVMAISAQSAGSRVMPVAQGKIPPAWNSRCLVAVNGRRTVPACWELSQVEQYLERSEPRKLPKSAWEAQALQGSDTVALALSPNAVLAVSEFPRPRTLDSRWTINALDLKDGKLLWQQDLRATPLAGGLLIDRSGNAVVVMENGNIVCFGAADTLASLQ
jgi:outer membrane protein assembly factor BamB